MTKANILYLKAVEQFTVKYEEAQKESYKKLSRMAWKA